MKSILQEDREHCFICGRNAHADFFGLEEHHVFEGYGRRELSEEYGLKIYICGGRCHREGPESVHKNAETDRAVKKIAQQRAMQRYGMTVEQFIKLFRKNYL